MIKRLSVSNSVQNNVAIVFVHGFTGDCVGTWHNIPDLLGSEKQLAGWDLYGFGYESKKRIDIRHIWSADAGLEELATELVTTPEIRGYQRVAFAAHSMGGLIVQRALVKSPELRESTSHVILFGTPSAGLGKASFFATLNLQVRDMNASGPFIRKLREDWTALYLDTRAPFSLLAVAGENDQFVPPESSIYPFPEANRAVIAGNHLTMLRTDVLNPAPAVKLLIERITRGAAPSGRRSAAALAIENGQFQRAIDKLEPIANELDDGGAALLALALDSVGRREDAIKVLESHNSRGTDALGVLAGRYKRRWLVEHRQADFDKSFALYRQAYQTACGKTPEDCSQAYYHGVNLAYLNLAANNRQDARTLAAKVLEHCCSDSKENQKDIFWRLASEGDACTILGQKENSFAKHVEASKLKLNLWQALSIQEQAVRVADLCGWTDEEQSRLSALYLNTSPAGMPS